MSVVKVNISANSFSGVSGKKYIVYPSLSVERYSVLEKMIVEAEYGMTISGFQAEIDLAYDALNNGKPADAAVILNNTRNGASRIDAGQPSPLITVCALFICPEGEDQGRWSEAEAQEKVSDWANIDVDFFLTCARALLLRYMPAFNTDSLNTSEAESER